MSQIINEDKATLKSISRNSQTIAATMGVLLVSPATQPSTGLRPAHQAAMRIAPEVIAEARTIADVADAALKAGTFSDKQWRDLVQRSQLICIKARALVDELGW